MNAESSLHHAEGRFTRIVRRAALWLVIGVALNILITWFGANFGPATQRWVPAREWKFTNDGNWPAPAPEGSLKPGRTQWNDYWWGRHYYAEGQVELPATDKNATAIDWWGGHPFGGRSADSLRMDRYIVGWPFRSMTCWYTERWGLNPMSKIWHDAWTLEVNPRYALLFPFRIIPEGFALNTLVYAVAAWFLLRLPGWVRGALRYGRGRCTACGYSRAGLASTAPCPECGHARTETTGNV